MGGGGEGSKLDSWCYIKQQDLFYLKKRKKKKTCGKSWENERSKQVLGAFQLVSERERNCPQDRCNPHPPSVIGERLTCQKRRVSSRRGIVKAVNVLAMRKQKNLYRTFQHVEA